VRANRPDVLDEVFDGEAVLVNLITGCYYALDASATEIWGVLQGGRTPDGAARILTERHGLTPGRAEQLLTPFIDRLLEEQLVVTGRPGETESPPPSEGPAPGRALAEPGLQRFEDMQDLLLMDPVHDIDLDGDGWPVRRGEPVAEVGGREG
jgi:hypothetical protein